MVIDLNTPNRMWFTYYRAWGVSMIVFVYELYSEYNKLMGEDLWLIMVKYKV